MTRMEIWTGRERRRKWSDDQKLEILEEVATSGLSVSAIARRHDIVPQQIYTWRRQLLGARKANRQEPPPIFLPVSVVAEADGQDAAHGAQTSRRDKPKSAGRRGRIEIRCKGGRVLTIEPDLDPEVLRALIRSVEEA